jgi:hypothetical protein
MGTNEPIPYERGLKGLGHEVELNFVDLIHTSRSNKEPQLVF